MNKLGGSSNKTIEVFTDGSCMKKKTGMICGYGAYFPNKELPNLSKPFTHIPLTNQRTELYAIYKAIKKVHKYDGNININIYSDSEYSIKSLTVWINEWKKNGWKTSQKKPVMNRELIEQIDALINKHKGKIKFIHVTAHTGGKDIMSINNDIVDTLAKNGALKIK